jgi:hypothetical protein
MAIDVVIQDESGKALARYDGLAFGSAHHGIGEFV